MTARRNAPSYSESGGLSPEAGGVSLAQSRNGRVMGSPKDGDLPFKDVVVVDQPGREPFDGVLAQLCGSRRVCGQGRAGCVSALVRWMSRPLVQQIARRSRRRASGERERGERETDGSTAS